MSLLHIESVDRSRVIAHIPALDLTKAAFHTYLHTNISSRDIVVTPRWLQVSCQMDSTCPLCFHLQLPHQCSSDWFPPRVPEDHTSLSTVTQPVTLYTRSLLEYAISSQETTSVQHETSPSRRAPDHSPPPLATPTRSHQPVSQLETPKLHPSDISCPISVAVTGTHMGDPQAISMELQPWDTPGHNHPSSSQPAKTASDTQSIQGIFQQKAICHRLGVVALSLKL